MVFISKRKLNESKQEHNLCKLVAQRMFINHLPYRANQRDSIEPSSLHNGVLVCQGSFELKFERKIKTNDFKAQSLSNAQCRTDGVFNTHATNLAAVQCKQNVKHRSISKTNKHFNLLWDYNWNRFSNQKAHTIDSLQSDVRSYLGVWSF